jgi:hypothetical protein
LRLNARKPDSPACRDNSAAVLRSALRSPLPRCRPFVARTPRSPADQIGRDADMVPLRCGGSLVIF